MLSAIELMRNEDVQQAAIVGYLAGATASGKSDLAVALAVKHRLAIVSADSMQVYRGMTIGTGALTPAEMAGVTHHLIGIADPREEFHAARFVEQAKKAIAREWNEAGRRTLVVGGTGMWIQSLREGLFEGPGRDEALRAELRNVLLQHDASRLHEMLAEVDPPMAARLSPNDHVRVLRAIEVFRLSGKRHSDWLAEDEARRRALDPLPPLVVIDLPREQLYDRINRRVDKMLAAGWLEEARALLELELTPESPPRKALGYRELFAVLQDGASLELATSQIKQETRRFAKRQLSWFRGQRGATWITPPFLENAECALGLAPHPP